MTDTLKRESGEEDGERIDCNDDKIDNTRHTRVLNCRRKLLVRTSKRIWGISLISIRFCLEYVASLIM
jgi:hypothetical protein